MKKNKVKDHCGTFPLVRKGFLIMRLFLFLMILGVLQSTASVSQTKRFNLNEKNISVKEALKLIEEQSEFRFFYEDNKLNIDEKINISISNSTIEEVLDQLLRQTGIEYKLMDNNFIVLKSENIKNGNYFNALQQSHSVSGKATDSSGAPLPGVSVVVKGTTIGTITNFDGNFSLSNVPANAILIFSFVGMKSQEIKVEGKLTVNVILEEEAIGIEEVIAVGYGTQKKINLTGSISQVKADELIEIPMPTLAQSAMGKASGVFIKNVNGQPGDDSGVQINIRGFGSPLFIVDGMPVSETYFQQLDPNDIEDFNILKDASAAAVYGARAGNGVILVKTKRGNNSGKPQFSYNGNYSLQFIAIRPDFVSSAQYAEIENMARYNQGLDPIWTEEEIQKFRDGSDPIHYPNVDWWKATLRQFAPQQQHNINVKGGSDKVRYFVSGGYFQQEGMLRSDDIRNNRYNLRSNLDIELTKRLKMGIDLSMINQDYTGPRYQMERAGSISGIMTMIYRVRPYWLNQTSPDPNYVLTTPEQASPVAYSKTENVGYEKWTRLVGDAKINFSYDLPFGFNIKALFDYSRAYYRYKQKMTKTPLYYYNPDTQEYQFMGNTNDMSKLTERQDITNNMNQQYFLSWNKQFDAHNFSALFVYELLADNYDYFTASRQNYQFDLDYLFAGPDKDKDNFGSAREGGRKAYIGRINYDYKGKYLLEFSSRYDGSVNFPSKTRWGFFPSASFGWRISEENFMKERFPFVDNLKLRASYGTLGYDPTSDPSSSIYGSFQYMTTYSINGSYIYDNTDVLSRGLRADALANPDITWEKMYTTNAGVDFGLWGHLLEGSFDYFYRKRTDVLGQRISSIPDVVGANMPNVNYREYDNRGWEVTLSHENKIGGLHYSLRGNLSWNREKVLMVDQPEYANEEIRRKSNQIGEWTDRTFTYPTDGLFKSFEEIQNWPDIDGKNNATIKPGDVKYIDSNGDGQITADDQILAGRGDYPRLTYGINMAVEWKGFDFSMLWQGAGLFNFNLRNSPDLTIPLYSANTPTTDMYYNSYVPEGNPWMEPNTDARWPLFRTDSYNRSHKSFTSSQFWLIDGSYIRLKNVQFGYTLPRKLIGKWGIQKCKIYVSGYNLLTFSKLDFLDPEADTKAEKTFGDYHPPVGSYNLGIMVNF
ncbi:MAG: TonB-dependent receptor [Mangrovibacterium sp.]